MLEYYQNLHLEIDSELEFGKYQGEIVNDVIDNDPEYIEWLNEEGVSFSDEIIELLERL